MSRRNLQSMVEKPSDFDFHQLLLPTPTREEALKDSASHHSDPSSDASSFFMPERLSRTNSVFSFSRASFSSQLNSLTSLSLPQAESLAANIASLPTARKAVKALNASAEQIQQWTQRAMRVLKELDSDDDVEWAAAAGREGLDIVDGTITSFKDLLSVYVQSIEEVQGRPDIADVKSSEFNIVVEQMELTLVGWDDLEKDLKRIHDQVELAMEWEELWSSVLADVGNELDSLSQLAFEMEEKRHNAFQTQNQNADGPPVDLNEIEREMDDPTQTGTKVSQRFSLPAFDKSPLGSPMVENPQDDSNLLALFARMQPLRASLDFLPMRIQMFQTRAGKIFASACRDLEDKRDRLEKNWSQLNQEAENLRRELSEDRWVIVFRNAGRQAQKMCESVERSVIKVQEGLDEGFQSTNGLALGKRIESYEAKKMHYMPAIHRVLSIIQKGLKDRLTVNGEILRLNLDLSTRMRDLTEKMEALDVILEPTSSSHHSRLRESISSIVSADRSLSSTFAGTPGTSPASSIDIPPPRLTQKQGVGLGVSSRPPSSARRPIGTTNRRSSVLPPDKRPTTPMLYQSSSTLPRRGVSPAPGTVSVYRQGVYVPPVASVPKRPSPSPVPTKPRWSSVVKTTQALPSKMTSSTMLTPTPNRKYTPRSISSATAVPLRSPLSRETVTSPSPAIPGPTPATERNRQFKSFAERIGSPTPINGGIMDSVPYHRGRNVTAPVHGTIRSPSSYGVNKQREPTMSHGSSHIREPSVTKSPPQKSLPLRSVSANPKVDRQSEDSAIGLDADQEYDDQEDFDQLMADPGSSPLSRQHDNRSSSVLGIARKGRRVSLLPVPVGGGRQSALGHRIG